MQKSRYTTTWAGYNYHILSHPSKAWDLGHTVEKLTLLEPHSSREQIQRPDSYDRT